VIASHYAEPVARKLRTSATLRCRASSEAEPVRELQPGERFLMVDESLGWAWGYAGEDRRVGYVAAEALEPQ
jgi:hypothetical protein